MDMKFICPKCNNNVPLEHVGLFSSNCQVCGTKFNNVKSHNQIEKKNTIERYEKIREYPKQLKPVNSKCDFNRENNNITLNIGSAGFIGNSRWALLITLFIAVFSFWFYNDMGIFSIHFIVVFIVNLVVLCIFLYLLVGKISLTINHSETKMKRSIFGIGFTKIKQTANFLCVKKVVMHQEGSRYSSGHTRRLRDVFGVGIIFRDLSDISFGANLPDEDKDWLLYELNEIFKKINKL